MEVKYKKDDKYNSHLISIEDYCCKDMKDEFSGVYASQIEFYGDDGDPGIYFMNSDYEQGKSPFYKLDYCPFCGKKIDLIEI